VEDVLASELIVVPAGSSKPSRTVRHAESLPPALIVPRDDERVLERNVELSTVHKVDGE